MEVEQQGAQWMPRGKVASVGAGETNSEQQREWRRWRDRFIVRDIFRTGTVASAPLVALLFDGGGRVVKEASSSLLVHFC